MWAKRALAGRDGHGPSKMAPGASKAPSGCLFLFGTMLSLLFSAEVGIAPLQNLT